MGNVPNISANVGVAPDLHTSPYEKRKILKKKKKKKKYNNYISHLDGKKTARDILIQTGQLEESSKSEYKTLKDNKEALTPEEKKEVMDKKATWHNGITGGPSPAVWKSKDKSGKTWYVTNTHRAWQKRPSLKGAISIFHSFIKGTA